MHPKPIYVNYNKAEIIQRINTAIIGEKSIMESCPNGVFSNNFRIGERIGSVI